MRSSLEARHAPLYDLRRWPRIYEPADFRAYLPDFALTGASLVYTESKPIVDLPNNLTRKIALSGCGVEDVMVVGLNVRPSQDWLGFLSMGWFRNANLADDRPGEWSEAILASWSPGHYGLCPSRGSTVDRISGLPGETIVPV